MNKASVYTVCNTKSSFSPALDLDHHISLMFWHIWVPGSQSFLLLINHSKNVLKNLHSFLYCNVPEISSNSDQFLTKPCCCVCHWSLYEHDFPPMVNHCASCAGSTLEAMSNALIRTSFTASGTWDSWSCSTDRALAPFERRRSECVSHAEWRTDVLYGGSNIVLGCLHCTWWYGANRGICQMQSGVMERRDRAWIGKREGSGGGWTAWALTNSPQSISCGGDKDQNMLPSLHEDSSALFWGESITYNTH